MHPLSNFALHYLSMIWIRLQVIPAQKHFDYWFFLEVPIESLIVLKCMSLVFGHILEDQCFVELAILKSRACLEVVLAHFLPR